MGNNCRQIIICGISTFIHERNVCVSRLLVFTFEFTADISIRKIYETLNSKNLKQNFFLLYKCSLKQLTLQKDNVLRFLKDETLPKNITEDLPF